MDGSVPASNFYLLNHFIAHLLTTNPLCSARGVDIGLLQAMAFSADLVREYTCYRAVRNEV